MTAQETAIPSLLSLMPTPRLRIALLGYRSHPHVGGQGIYLKYLSKALVEAGHRVDVISGPPYPELDERVSLIKLPSLDLYAVEAPWKALRPKHLLSYSDTFEWASKMTGGFAEPYTFSRRVARYLSKHGHNYDLVHDNQCLGYGLLRIAKRGLPVIATVHHPITRDLELALNAESDWGMRLLIKRWYLFLKMQTRVVKKLPHVVTVSECSKTDIADAFGRSQTAIDVIPNGIDTETFRPLDTVNRCGNKIVTTASSDQPLKGQRYLLEAFQQLQAQYPKLELHVVGQLKSGGDTEKHLNTLGIKERVTFHSRLSTEALVTLFNEATIAITPSLYEGFGLPVGEAMACGTPVIATTGGALPEVVGDAGLLIPPGNSTALAKAIDELLQSPSQQAELSKKGRQRILEHFSWKEVARRFTDYYHTMLQLKPNAND
ncbi:glycosyltransferase family 4 protein [Marinibactrum halimedae]|uniref:Glycosyl transferase family 1 n=1 Tax=Marinibactrum halimedae TaxID=1444977 RepID=A0AA37T2M3_9GAMM|nr:glycosyltransferase family 4 protein [Marinibactrum halimedae]MCD9459325.1 glycosyltransferase family 4 protein [Marinibactrum halimedae]GLS25784.1 glycosyl transferase family 1 [Marinibactrum halimedae]